MLQAMIFDLDGTLVQTERLKALSYARAAAELCPTGLQEADVVESFKDVVGLSRREVAMALLERFGLEQAARARMTELGVQTPWQAFLQIRLRIYQDLIADPEVLRRNQWPHNVELLHQARRVGCKTALATMSHRDQVQRVLEILDLTDAFELVVSRDDVEQGKPNPEIYLLVSCELDVSPSRCLVIEDSPAGVKAALAAGMRVIAVTTPFTEAQFKRTDLLDRRWVVDDPHTLAAVVQEAIATMKNANHGGV